MNNAAPHAPTPDTADRSGTGENAGHQTSGTTLDRMESQAEHSGSVSNAAPLPSPPAERADETPETDGAMRQIQCFARHPAVECLEMLCRKLELGRDAALRRVGEVERTIAQVDAIAGRTVAATSVEAVQDLKADCLRLHREKMEMFDRAVAAESALHSSRARMRERAATALHGMGDSAYCRACEMSKDELCLGEAHKIESGAFSLANLKALENVRRKFGEADGYWNAAAAIRALPDEE